MKNLILALLVVLISASPLPAQSNSVINSTIAKSTEIDWLVDKDNQGHCTGIQIGIRWILTAAHCLPPEELKTDVYVDKVAARIVKKDPEVDLAILEVPTDAKAGIIELRKEQLQYGEKLIAVGFAWDEPIIVLHRTVGRWDDEALYTDGSFIPGMSGGPVVDANGKLVGMIQRGYQGNIGGAISTKVIKEFLK